MAAMLAGRPNLFGMSLAELRTTLGELETPFRSRQVYDWLYRQRVRQLRRDDQPQPHSAGAAVRLFSIAWPEQQEQRLSDDGTRKYLFRLSDGAMIESVMIPQERRRTICVSTQAGCPLKCTFCLTGVGGYGRNLTPGEILGQVAAVMSEIGPAETDEPRPWNVVFMGMGEPLLNVDATLAAVRVLLDPKAYAVAPRKLTVSTVGIIPALDRMAAEPVPPNLAISLHAATPELRLALMPIEARYPLDAVLAAAERYPNPGGAGVTFEYVLLRNVNDSVSEARQLVKLLKGRRCKVNLIPLNPAAELPYEPPDPGSRRRLLPHARRSGPERLGAQTTRPGRPGGLRSAAPGRRFSLPCSAGRPPGRDGARLKFRRLGGTT